MNLLLKCGVRSSPENVKSGDLQKARALSNPDLSPHLSFVDMDGHGYAVVHVAGDSFETDFVCIPAPSSAVRGPTEASPRSHETSSRSVAQRGEAEAGVADS
jgi:alkaline phosphatase D